MPFDPDKYLEAKSSFDPDAYLSKVAPKEIGALEAAARGAGQWGTLGFADEIAGAGSATIDAIKNMSINGWADNYGKARSEYEANDDLAWEQHPIAYGTGAAVGGVASSVVPGAIAGKLAARGGKAVQAARAMTEAESIADTLAKARKLGIIGGAGAAGMSAANLISGESLPEELKTFGKDVALGAVTAPGMGIAAETILPAAVYGIKKAGAKARNTALNAVLGVPEDITERYLENPTAVRNAGTREEFAQKLANTLADLKEESRPVARQMMDVLSGKREVKDGFEADRIISILKSIDDPYANKLAEKLSSDLESRAPFRNQAPRPETLTRKMEFKPRSTPEESGFNYEITKGKEAYPRPLEDRISGYDQFTGAPIYDELPPVQSATAQYIKPKPPLVFDKVLSEKRIPFVPETPEFLKYITEKEAHSAKRVMQDAGDFNSAIPSSQKAIANEKSGSLAALLRSANPEYSELADKVQQDIIAKKALASKFGLKADYLQDNKLNYTDRTMSAISDLSRAKKIDRIRVLEQLKNLGYGDLGEDAKNVLAKEAFDGGAAQGSRRTLLGTVLGGALGSVAGGPFGAGIGGAVGAYTGAAADKYGPKMGQRLLDMNIGAAEKLVPLSNATSKIPMATSAAITTPRITEALQPKQEKFIDEKQAADDYINRR